MDLSKALEILGLPRGASMPEVKKAYREQARLWHPDRYSEASALKKQAEKNIQDANLAYAFLKRQAQSAAGARPKPARRKPPDNRASVFDKLCAGSLHGSSAFSPESIWAPGWIGCGAIPETIFAPGTAIPVRPVPGRK